MWLEIWAPFDLIVMDEGLFGERKEEGKAPEERRLQEQLILELFIPYLFGFWIFMCLVAGE